MAHTIACDLLDPPIHGEVDAGLYAAAPLSCHSISKADCSHYTVPQTSSAPSNTASVFWRLVRLRNCSLNKLAILAQQAPIGL
jgi:hypothetical protein